MFDNIRLGEIMVLTIKYNGHSFLRDLLFTVFITYSCCLQAVTDIEYEGLYFGRARFVVDGRTVKLKPGEVSRQGMKLLSANEDRALITIAGKKFIYHRDSNEGILYEEELKLSRDVYSGHYWTNGSVNGEPVTFVVDTGASHVTLNKELARKLRIRTGNNRVSVQTASKEEQAYLVTLESVSIGGIELREIPAIITTHDFPTVPLLGMSFLARMEITHSGDQMSIKYTGN